MKKVIGFFLLPAVLVLSIFTACNKNAATEITSELVDETLYSVQDRGGLGKYGCYELVFPVEFTLPDGTVVAANSYDDIKAALKTYFDANGGPGNGNGNGHHNGPRKDFFRKIAFTYPVSVIDEAGAVITVNNEQELADLRAACGGGSFGNHGHNGHGNHGLSCYTFNFPITIAFPDGTTQEVADRQALKTAIRSWNSNNPTSPTRPEITFPISVTMTADGTVVTVDSKDELRQLKKDCQ